MAMIQDVSRREPTLIWWTYDGTQASIDELAQRWVGAADHPALGDADDDACQIGNPGMGFMLAVADATVCVFEVSPDGDRVRLVADYPDATAAAARWAPT